MNIKEKNNLTLLEHKIEKVVGNVESSEYQIVIFLLEDKLENLSEEDIKEFGIKYTEGGILMALEDEILEFEEDIELMTRCASSFLDSHEVLKKEYDKYLETESDPWNSFYGLDEFFGILRNHNETYIDFLSYAISEAKKETYSTQERIIRLRITDYEDVFALTTASRYCIDKAIRKALTNVYRDGSTLFNPEEELINKEVIELKKQVKEILNKEGFSFEYTYIETYNL